MLGDVPRANVDAHTVERLHLLAPASSSTDRDRIDRLLRDDAIFSTVNDPVLRRSLSNNIKAVSCLIPSLFTFFENLKYIEPCCAVLRSLLPPKSKKSLRQSLFGIYFQPDSLLIQTPSADLKASKSNPHEDRNRSYHQLWLFAMRNFPDMIDIAPRKEAGRAKRPHKESSPILWNYLGALAVSSGFKTQNALKYQGQRCGPDVNARSNPGIPHNETAFHAEAQLTTSYSRLAHDRRCGRPYEDDHKNDQKFLFLQYTSQKCETVGREITPFFVKVDFLRSFLGNTFFEVCTFSVFALSAYLFI